jgi:hypothetical protein
VHKGYNLKTSSIKVHGFPGLSVLFWSSWDCYCKASLHKQPVYMCCAGTLTRFLRMTGRLLNRLSTFGLLQTSGHLWWCNLVRTKNCLSNFTFAAPGLRAVVPCGGGLEYLHRNPASRKRRRKGNPVSNETVIYGYGPFATLTNE